MEKGKIDKESGLPESLILDWQRIMSLTKQSAENSDHFFDIRVQKDKKIRINGCTVICHFINSSYIEAEVDYKGETVLRVKHLGTYAKTVGIILFFIDLNFKK